MITQCLIENLLEENQRLEKEVIACEEEVSFELFSKWRSNQEKIGEYLVDEAFCYIAKKYDAYILSNPVNSSSYAYFTRLDVQSKTFNIRGRTLRAGMRSGFLDLEGAGYEAKPLVFSMQGQRLYAATREGRECLVKEIRALDEIIKVACYEDGSYITSDVDLIAIFLRDNSDELLFDPMYGELTSYELVLLRDLNQSFQELVSKYFPSLGVRSFRLVAHGAANRFSRSKASHLHYPLKVCTPTSSVEFLGQEESSSSTREFLEFNQRMKSLGYHAYLNPRWDF